MIVDDRIWKQAGAYHLDQVFVLEVVVDRFDGDRLHALVHEHVAQLSDMTDISVDSRARISRPARSWIVSSMGEEGPVTIISLTFFSHGSTSSTTARRSGVIVKLAAMASHGNPSAHRPHSDQIGNSGHIVDVYADPLCIFPPRRRYVNVTRAARP